MVLLRLFGSFLLTIINTARAIIYFVLRIFSFIANIIGLFGLIYIIVSVKSWVVDGWSDNVKVHLLCSLFIFGCSFLYHLVMYVIEPKG